MRNLCTVLSVLLLAAFAAFAGGKEEKDESITVEAADLRKINCGNLVYAANQTSVCFADAFLRKAAQETRLSIAPHFVRVPLDTAEAFDFPFCVFSGEGTFRLTQPQRDNFRRYILGGGFILASPGCSDAEWNKSFLTEMKLIFPDYTLQKIPMDNSIFSVVHKITELHDKEGKRVLVEGLLVNGRVALVYSVEGLNDVEKAKGCCCCGGNEIMESRVLNVNILTYALLY